MTNFVADNKRIAKNTFLLYIRTFFVMIISFFTSRLVLQALGVEDYGVYNVVGGIVAMFAVISNSLSAAISRFITFEIGRGDKYRLQQVFSTSKTVLLILAIVVVLLSELVGTWFLKTQMQIPEGRMQAAVWVMHTSILSFFVNLIAIPYTACVIAHEHMKAFAYISLFEAFLKLGICLILNISPIDKLVFYAILMAFLSVLIRTVYSIYCHRQFSESRTPYRLNKPIFKEIFGFAGWSFFTSINSTLSNQGVNMLINVFFGVTFNAARGLANQVQGAMSQFVSSFVSAINPQITKSYAAGEIDNMHSLICRGARFSYYLTLVMVVPVFFEAEAILSIWLTIVPEKAVIFTRLSLIYILMDGAGYTSYTANLATGRIMKYSLVLSSITFFVFPITWLLFDFGSAVESTYYVWIIANLFYHIARLFLTQENVGLKAMTFIKKVYVPVIKTTVLSIIPSMIIIRFMPQNMLRLCISVVVGIGISGLMSFFVGMTKNERGVIVEKTKNVLNNFLVR